tara:strand:- start:168 stop:494 length:327 start_codon:yes stop_codon:yes gene_type:complete
MKNVILKDGKPVRNGQGGTGKVQQWIMTGTFKKVNSIELHRDGFNGEPLTEAAGDLTRGEKWADLDLVSMWEAKQPATVAPQNVDALKELLKGLSPKELKELVKQANS